ncbi:hypothetical protein AT15_02235 [Kosmotoga arenicorallina S304]|uniref:Uncharacterized protein n=1 Tax=Kosmotoga arenicorallina S304 TaxID=1453497 RepID=A0A176JZ92_9BACT|nr:hypothetical protein [Kosmotoga arenicorallina]OAA29359.1 hypothetical protein AT15_02235 [Kosmotoga arenicorallina S304]
MKRLIIILFLIVSLVAFATEEELKAKLEENPRDFEALQELLEIYEENEDYSGYIDTMLEITEKLEDAPTEIMPYVLQAARYAADQYYDAESVSLYTYFLNALPRMSVLEEFMSAFEYMYDYDGTPEEVIMKSISAFDDQKATLEEIRNYAEEEYLTYVQSDIEKILYEKFGETQYMFHYLESLLRDQKYDEVEKALIENEENLKDNPMFYYTKGVLAAVNEDYDETYKQFKIARAMEDGARKLDDALNMLDIAYVPDYLIEFFQALLIDLDEKNQQLNLMNYAAKNRGIKWISGFLEELPEPPKISDALKATGTLYAVTEYNPESDTVYFTIVDNSGKKLIRLPGMSYGRFFKSGLLYVDFSGYDPKVVYEGEEEKHWVGYNALDVSPKGDKILISDYDSIKFITSDFEALWEYDIPLYEAFPISWSVDEKYLMVENYDNYLRYLINTGTGEIIETFDNSDNYDYLFLGKSNEVYGIDYDGNIEKLSPVKPLLTSRKAKWAIMVDDENLLYFESLSGFLDNLYLGNLMLYNTKNHTEKPIASNVLFVPALIPSVTIKSGKIIYTGYDTELEKGFMKVHDLETGETTILEEIQHVVLAFPDILQR